MISNRIAIVELLAVSILVYLVCRRIFKELMPESRKFLAGKVDSMDNGSLDLPPKREDWANHSIQTNHERAMAQLASQVSHDIRSPLAALNFITSRHSDIPEETRAMIRDATQRITDIANKLMSSHCGTDSSPPVELISSLVDSLVSQKRIEFRNKVGLELEVDLSRADGLFARVIAVELKRALSDVINNAVEALPNESGKVLVIVSLQGDNIIIEVKDNGPGIAGNGIASKSKILPILDTSKNSFPKAKGTSAFGLGLFHAMETAERVGGLFTLESTKRMGVSARFSFPNVASPKRV